MALLHTRNVAAGREALDLARREIENRQETDGASEAFRRNRMIIAAIQTLAFAGWSEDPTVSLPERRQGLNKADKYLADAEEFAAAVKSKSATLSAARVDVPKARGKLDADERNANPR
ncbi:MAG: hypothetical protein L6Q38_11730 [Nitrospira sp.]|nr:hypothetical protein [Nitrospira sp.]